MDDFQLEERVDQAVSNFESGYNCAQSVFLAYHDLFGLDRETASRMSVSFGGGMGRMREVCGAVSAMAMLAGFKYPVADPSDRDARTCNYAMVQKMADHFKEKNETIICRDLLKLSAKKKESPQPEERTKMYYNTRPCAKFVADAAWIAGKMIKGELLQE